MVASIIRKSVGLLVSLAIFFLTFTYLMQPVKFQGTSMWPAISNGDRIFILKSFWKPERGDVVAFRYPKDPSKSYIKRIIGMPGEVLEIRDGQVWINGNSLEEPYVNPELNSARSHQSPIQIPERHYYIMGDSRDNSSDSRHWGLVSEDLIYGKYLWRYMKARQ